MNRSELDFSFLIFGYRCEKAVKKRKRNRKERQKTRLKTKMSNICKKLTFSKMKNQTIELKNQAIPVVKGYEYENIIRSKTKGILNVLFRQGKILKYFKEPERFLEPGVSQSTVYFKINLLKPFDKNIRN